MTTEIQRLRFALVALTSLTCPIPALAKLDRVEMSLGTVAWDNSHSLSENEIQFFVENFSKKIGLACLQQNLDARKAHQPSCDQNFCAESFKQMFSPNSLRISVSLSQSDFGPVARLWITWNWIRHNDTSLGVCYHPQLTPVVLDFETTLRNLRTIDTKAAPIPTDQLP
jgi:hypothetical protein